jgi:hypothetical protein
MCTWLDMVACACNPRYSGGGDVVTG